MIFLAGLVLRFSNDNWSKLGLWSGLGEALSVAAGAKFEVLHMGALSVLALSVWFGWNMLQDTPKTKNNLRNKIKRLKESNNAIWSPDELATLAALGFDVNERERCLSSRELASPAAVGVSQRTYVQEWLKVAEECGKELRNAWFCAVLSWIMLYAVFAIGEAIIMPEPLIIRAASTLFNSLASVSLGAAFFIMTFPSGEVAGASQKPSKMLSLKSFWLLGLVWSFASALFYVFLTVNNDSGSWIVEFYYGMVASVGMSMLVARLDSKLIGANSSVLAMLFCYAAIQPFWPFINDANIPVFDRPVLVTPRDVLLIVALMFKGLLALTFSWFFTTGRADFYFIRVRRLHEQVDADWRHATGLGILNHPNTSSASNQLLKFMIAILATLGVLGGGVYLAVPSTQLMVVGSNYVRMRLESLGVIERFPRAQILHAGSSLAAKTLTDFQYDPHAQGAPNSQQMFWVAMTSARHNFTRLNPLGDFWERYVIVEVLIQPDVEVKAYVFPQLEKGEADQLYDISKKESDGSINPDGLINYEQLRAQLTKAENAVIVGDPNSATRRILKDRGIITSAIEERIDRDPGKIEDEYINQGFIPSCKELKKWTGPKASFERVVLLGSDPPGGGGLMIDHISPSFPFASR